MKTENQSGYRAAINVVDAARELHTNMMDAGQTDDCDGEELGDVCELREALEAFDAVEPPCERLVDAAPYMLNVLRELTRCLESYLSGHLVTFPAAIRGMAHELIAELDSK